VEFVCGEDEREDTSDVLRFLDGGGALGCGAEYDAEGLASETRRRGPELLSLFTFPLVNAGLWSGVLGVDTIELKLCSKTSRSELALLGLVDLPLLSTESFNDVCGWTSDISRSCLISPCWDN